MILYHGSNIQITEVDFEKCKPYKDFGKGFYLTEIEEQAHQMSRRTALIYGGEAVVSNFEFDIDAAMNDSSLLVKQFEEPNEEWALFVMANRNRENQHSSHQYGIVSGKCRKKDRAKLITRKNNGGTSKIRFYEAEQFRVIKGIL